MDILEQLQRVLDATPEHQYLAAQPLSRKQLVSVIAEIRRLRSVSDEQRNADAQARTGINPNI